MIFLSEHSNFINFFIGRFDFSLSDFALSMILWPTFIIGLIAFGLKNKFFSFSFLYLYNLLYANFQNHLGSKGEKYINFLITLFFFLVFLNLGNMIPILFPSTSELSLTLTLAVLVFLLIVLIGLLEHGFVGFFKFFIPNGVPVILKPFLFILEFFSFLIRPFSLALRLTMNMIAGHVMLHVIASFGKGFVHYKLLAIFIGGFLGLFEIAVALLQAYVFVILSCIYISDILNSH